MYDGSTAPAKATSTKRYDNKIRRLKELSDTWWTKTQTKFNGALPVAMVKHWAELMGMSLSLIHI